jgi:sarcosine oxidase subunit delta
LPPLVQVTRDTVTYEIKGYEKFGGAAGHAHEEGTSK